MSASASESRRQFRVFKDNGEAWLMNFTSRGVQWVRDDNPLPSSPPGAAFAPRGPSQPSPFMMIGAVLDGAASIGMWWETRQQRLAGEAINDENRRIAWLEEMLVRWGDVHQGGDRLDLQISEYLAREARETLEALSGNRRIALPQALLYEIELVQESLRPLRLLLLNQFERLVNQADLGLATALNVSLPGSVIDMSYIRKLAADPSLGRDEGQPVSEFDRELNDLLRHPNQFLARVLPRGEHKPAEKPAEERRGSVFETLISALAPSIPKPTLLELKSDAAERRIAYRELTTLPAEVARVRGLHTAWIATNALIAAASGNDVVVRLAPDGVHLGLAPASSPLSLTGGARP